MVTEEHLALACAPACLSAGSWCQESSLLFHWKQNEALGAAGSAESVCMVKNWKSQINEIKKWEFLAMPVLALPAASACVHADGSMGAQSALQMSAAHFKCTDPAIPACCVFWESSPVCADSVWLHSAVKKGCSCGNIPCISQIPMACRVMRFIILAALLTPWLCVSLSGVYFPCRKVRTFLSLFSFLPPPRCSSHSWPFPFLSCSLPCG